MRSFFRRFFSIVLRIFFRRIEIAGAENVSHDGPIIFVLNHPNALIDPAFLLCLAPRPVSFLAKAPLFSTPVIGWLARAFDAIPVYRHQDADSNPAQNRETFEKSRALLAEGGTIAIFPEGTSHSDPKLRPLKTGAARIALSGAKHRPLQIIPAGIYYTAKGIFRSQALLHFSAPINVSAVPLDDKEEPSPDAVRELISKIETALREVTLQADRQEVLELVVHAERIFSSQESPADRGLADKFELRRELLERYKEIREIYPNELDSFISRLRRYVSVLELLHIHQLNPNTISRMTFTQITRFTLKTFLQFALLVLPATIGTIIHYPAYRLIGSIATRYSKEEDDLLATVKVFASILFFPLTWVFTAWFVAYKCGITPAVFSFFLSPLLGYLALIFWETWGSFNQASRLLFLYLFRRNAIERLLREQQKIRSEITKLLSLPALSSHR